MKKSHRLSKRAGRRRAHRKTAKKGKRATHRRTQRGGDIMDFFRSINPFGSNDPATEQALAPAQETAQTNGTVPPTNGNAPATNGTIYRTNFNNSIPETPEQAPIPDPKMRRRRNYRKNL